MIWIGIGLIIIGVAFIGLVVFLIKPLNKLASVLNSLQKTTDKLPKTVDDVTSQTTEAIGTGIDTLHQVNSQVKHLNPIFQIVGDAGHAANQLSSKMVDAVEDMKQNTQQANDFATRKNLEGLYGALTLGFFLFQKARK
ncbi:DUF948 domain-containing protein [Oceanobacillus profundus]|uniref:DUF948 domain-containing protein n=1 Tax=Oceanobacillus profundus TaxID=372463 RepID=A0A417YC55_9BACI|nr:DUF948 domain-containing protein [Oceanobacillus profundus]MCM3399575.1 DUF948 domain-containing protein [Oceanobacillus profundus]RHW30272.1 DUF948 domain-containing protein [Oceanobacillus profundus]